MLICSSEGDLGDACYVLGVLSELPNGPHVLLAEPSSRTKFRGHEGAQKLVDLIGPLARAQPYISECRVAVPGEHIDWRSAGFRTMGHYSMGSTLLQAHLNNLIAVKGIGHGITGERQWLHVDPDPRSKGRIVINRTGRYRNDSMPWLEIVKHYKHRLLFVGLPHEHKEFAGHFGWVDFMPTANMLEVARVIAGSELFIGNQSSSFACAEGLKHPRILEVNLQFPDTIFPGSRNALYVATGEVMLPAIDGATAKRLTRATMRLENLDIKEIPPGGGWIYDHPKGRILESTLKKSGRELARRDNISQEEAQRLVLVANVQRAPRHFSRQARVQEYHNVQAALSSAGITDHPVLRMAGGEINFDINNL